MTDRHPSDSASDDIAAVVARRFTPVQLWQAVMAMPDGHLRHRCPDCGKTIGLLYELPERITVLQTLQLSQTRRRVALGFLDRDAASDEGMALPWSARDWWLLGDDAAVRLLEVRYNMSAGRVFGFLPGERATEVDTWCRNCGDLTVAPPKPRRKSPRNPSRR